ncbi:circadian locomoter output cycles protein kaput [Caerostris extrusa]|uniref:Circadian locomoter output cycles protein kaput n=1 Tax=Caerostris extrusa TaxID=172846 RepID=A0AAV4VZR4_CAEEX|nr:circadian locomoter output cycles protein kaput [Caerostris extrusa]
MLSDCLNNGSSRCSFVCLMREKPQPRSEGITYKHVHFSGDMTNAEDISNEKASKSVVTHMFKAFVKVVNISPYNQLSLEEATADEYVTRHSLSGVIIFADHRLATITGHLPQEVIGVSAYEYIHKDDQPITLFAHRLMFSNAKGSGMIVYRLASTSKVDHLVCNNQQLDNSEGGIQLKYFFDKLNPHVIGNSLEDLQQSVRSLDISESLNHKVNGAMQLNGESPNHSTESDSSNIDSDELKNPKDDYRNDISDNCSSSDQEAFQENGSSYPGSPDHAANNGSISPCSSDTTEYKCDIKDQIYSICMTNTEYFITDINGSSSSSEPANDIYASDDNSVLSVNQSHNVHTPNKIMSLSKIPKNSHNLIEGPNHYMHNFQDTAFESLDSNSDTSDCGYSSCNGLDRNASMQINAQCQQVRTMGVNDQNVNKDLASLEKIYEEETIFDTDMFSSHQNATCSAESSPLLEVKTNSHYKINDEILECAEEPFVKHSS